jgi:hypothetical protein
VLVVLSIVPSFASRTRVKFILASTLLLFLCGGSEAVVFAQTAGTGALNGTVTDPDKATVAGVEVIITREDSGNTNCSHQ